MTTYELLDELSKKPNEEIKYALMILMERGKIDYTDLSQSFVGFIQRVKDDYLNKLIEAETCVMESFDKKKTKVINQSNRDYKHTQRCLYLINESKRFNMDSTNKKFNYDAEFAKKMSWYERNKELND